MKIDAQALVSLEADVVTLEMPPTNFIERLLIAVRFVWSGKASFKGATLRFTGARSVPT